MPRALGLVIVALSIQRPCGRIYQQQLDYHAKVSQLLYSLDAARVRQRKGGLRKGEPLGEQILLLISTASKARRLPAYADRKQDDGSPT
jgi:hypothetical protein